MLLLLGLFPLELLLAGSESATTTTCGASEEEEAGFGDDAVGGLEVGGLVGGRSGSLVKGWFIDRRRSDKSVSICGFARCPVSVLR